MKQMTANDIANMVEKEPYHTNLNRITIANFIRQQQAEIEALKANRKHDFGLGEASGFIKGHKENPYKAITNTKIEPTVVSYTHPVKELTYEEITICMGSLPKYNSEIVDEDLVNFARAILRKASEK